MGRCLEIGGTPFAINIQLPGGINIGSMASGTQWVPNIMDPFQSLLQGIQPALGSLQPLFDIIGFVMKLMQCLILLAKVMGAVMGFIMPGNPFSLMFSVDPVTDEDGVPIKDPVTGNEIPDFAAIGPDLINCLMQLMGGALKLAGLIPQISMGVTIKDAILAAIGFIDAIMAQLNSLFDVFIDLPSPDSGNLSIDFLLQCAADNSSIQLEHKLGPAANLVQLLSVISLLAQAAAQPLPGVVYDMSKMLADLGLLPFVQLPGGPPPDEQEEQFLGMVQDLTITGLPIEIPDLSDMSDLGQKLKDMQEQLGPVLPAIELVQEIFDKLTKALENGIA